MRKSPAGAARTLAAVTLLGVLVGCGGSDTGSPMSAAPSENSKIDGLERFAAVTIPSDAHEVVIESRTNQDGQPVYTSHFSITPDGARAFCAANGLGGALPWLDGLDQANRTYFQVTGDSTEEPFSCRSTSPDHSGVQRDVLVTLPTHEKAIVHLVASKLPR